MKYRHKLIVAMALILLLSAFDSLRKQEWGVIMNASLASDSEFLKIRIRNGSNLDFNEVRVFFPDRPDQAVNYRSIQRGALSHYQTVSRAYRYAHIEVAAGNSEFVLRPIDYVGEQELPAGHFTYVIRIEDGRMNLELEQND